MMTYSEVLVANLEPGTWIIYDNKLLNLECLEVQTDTSNAMHTLGNLYPRRPVGPDASTEDQKTKQLWRSLSRRLFQSREIQDPGQGRPFLITRNRESC